MNSKYDVLKTGARNSADLNAAFTVDHNIATCQLYGTLGPQNYQEDILNQNANL
jgi:hypothetical protein